MSGCLPTRLEGEGLGKLLSLHGSAEREFTEGTAATGEHPWFLQITTAVAIVLQPGIWQ